MRPLMLWQLWISDRFDRLYQWAWDWFELHPKWISRTLAAVTLGFWVLGLALEGLWLMLGVVGPIITGVMWGLDYSKYRHRPRDWSNLHALANRFNGFNAVFLPGYLVFMALITTPEWMAKGLTSPDTLSFFGAVMWVVHLYSLNGLIPTDPPKKRLKEKLSKLSVDWSWAFPQAAPQRM